MRGVSIVETPRQHRNFYIGQADNELTRAQVAGMQEQLRHAFLAYGMEAVNFEVSMSLHGGREWSLTVSVEDDHPPMEVSTFGSRQTHFIAGRRGSTVVVEGNSRDLQSAGTEASLFEQVARALHTLVRSRLIQGERMVVSCHELLHRAAEAGGVDENRWLPEYDMQISASSHNELRQNWGFSDEDVKEAVKDMAHPKMHGPTAEELEASYRV